MLPHGIDYKPSSRLVAELADTALRAATVKHPDPAKLHAINITLLSNRLPNLRGEKLHRAQQTLANLQQQLDQLQAQRTHEAGDAL